MPEPITEGIARFYTGLHSEPNLTRRVADGPAVVRVLCPVRLRDRPSATRPGRIHPPPQVPAGEKYGLESTLFSKKPGDKGVVRGEELYLTDVVGKLTNGMERGSMADVERRIKDILVNRLQIHQETVAGVDATTPLLGRGIGLDSMETLTLVTGIEEEFGIQVEDDDLTTQLFQSIGTLTAYVIKKTLPLNSP